MEMTSHLRFLPRLRMSGDVPLLLPYTLMACVCAVFPFFTYSSWRFEYLHEELKVLLVYCVSVVTVEWHRHKNVFIYTCSVIV